MSTQQQQQGMVFEEPRDLTRTLYYNAIRAAQSEQERAMYQRGIAFYEIKWQLMDENARKKATEDQESDFSSVRKRSAVEQHGIDSEEAEEARQKRREARKEKKVEEVDDVPDEASEGES